MADVPARPGDIWQHMNHPEQQIKILATYAVDEIVIQHIPSGTKEVVTPSYINANYTFVRGG